MKNVPLLFVQNVVRTFIPSIILDVLSISALKGALIHKLINLACFSGLVVKKLVTDIEILRYQHECISLQIHFVTYAKKIDFRKKDIKKKKLLGNLSTAVLRLN